jgi:hypothetical protein
VLGGGDAALEAAVDPLEVEPEPDGELLMLPVPDPIPDVVKISDR